MALGLALGIASAGIKIAGGIIGGRRRRRAAKERERQAKRDAQAVMRQAKYQIGQIRKAGQRAMAGTVTRAGAVGLKVGGSVAEVVEQSRRNMRADIRRTRQAASAQAQALRSEAAGHREAGRQELFGTILGTAGTILGAAGDLSGRFGGGGTSLNVGPASSSVATGPTATPTTLVQPFAPSGRDYYAGTGLLTDREY